MNNASTREWHELAPEIESLVRGLRELVVQEYNKPPTEATRKQDGSPVTALDLAIEERLVKALLTLDDSLGIASEEAGTVREGALMWHLDPVDGTANFASRVHAFATQLVLMDGLTPLFAAVYEPLTDDYTWASKGHGAYRQGRRLAMADVDPKHSRLHLDLTDKGLFARHPTMPMDLRQRCYRVRALGSVAIHLRDVASGAAHGYLGGRGPGTPLHDVGPGMLLVRESGGATSDGFGADPMVARDILIAASPRVHAWLCEEVHAREWSRVKAAQKARPKVTSPVPDGGTSGSLSGMTITLLTFEGGIEDFPSLIQTLDGLVQEEGQRVALDLSTLPFINSAALGYLLKAHQGLVANDGELTICSVQPAIANILQMTQLDQVFQVFDTPEQAVAYLGGNPEEPVPDSAQDDEASHPVRRRRWASK